MDTINRYSEFSQLAQASYSSLSPGSSNNIIVDALKDQDGAGFAQKQAEAFAIDYTVLSQVTDTNGFSATLFQNNITGEKTLAIRGTNDLFDGLTDVVDIALLGTTALQLQYQSLKDYYQQLIVEGQLGANEAFSVTGHSLGGFLAQSFAIDNSSTVSQTYTYNASGIGGVVAEVLSAFGITETNIPMPSITNIIAQPGLSATAGLGTQLGAVQNVFIEDSLNPIHNHSITTLTDSLAVYNLFATLDPTLNTNPNGVAIITAIIQGASHDPVNSLESVLDDLRTLFLQNYAGSNAILNAAPTAVDDRGQLYFNLFQLQDYLKESPFNIGALTDPTYSFTISSLSDSSIDATSLAVAAYNDISYRYALYKFNAFVISGAPALYSNINSGGELDLYSEATPNGMTEQYFQDRAHMLERLIEANNLDANFVPRVNGQSEFFYDYATQTQLSTSDVVGFFEDTWVNHPEVRETAGNNIFGSSADEIFVGGNLNDWFYGEARSAA